jgi:mannose-6-phosphate isomerase-like protein (cupin superfamily)
MAGYTIKNMKADVEDLAPKFGLSPGLESRFAREPLECEQFGVSYFQIAPGFRVPFGHRHQEQEEVYVVVRGSGRIKLDDEVLDLKQWDAVRMSPETMRCLEAGPEGAEVVAFGAPKVPMTDAEPEQGWWSD